MARTVVFVHTVNGLVELFSGLCAEIVPEASVCHIADETLIQAVLAAGGLTPYVYRRICEHAHAAEHFGANVVQVTCSSVSPCVDVARHVVAIPVLKVDEPMVESAVSGYDRIGVIATAPTTLEPTTDLIREKASRVGRAVEVESVLCEGAYGAIRAGDSDRHDEIVRRHMRDLMQRTDVLLLAQASMARVADTLPEGERTIPILTSPRPAVLRLAGVI